MSKYVIELDDTVKAVQKIAVTDCGRIYTHQWEVEDLEELTADYVNEHFGDLQDTAYQRGFEDGKWKSEDGCTGCKYEGKTGEHLPCDYCMNNFKNQWTAKDDEIEVGDEVKRKLASENDSRGIVTKEWGDIYYIMWLDGSSGRWDKDRIVKTGRHFDIASILEEMRHD